MSKNVPNLRFPGFSGKWEEIKLGDIGEFTGGGTPSTRNPDFWNGNIPWISSSDLILDDIKNIKISRFISDDAISSSATKLTEEGSVLIVSRVGVGKVAVAPMNLCTSQDFTNIRNMKGYPLFLAYQMSLRMGLEAKNTQGTSIKGIPMTEIKMYKLLQPSYLEQQKIADFLCTIDSRITNQSSKLDSLQELKKGIMQKIFSQEIRFKREDGSGYPDWEEKRLGDIGEFYSSGKLEKSSVGGVGEPCILYGELFTTYKGIIENIKSKTTDKELVYAYKNDVLFPTSTTVDNLSLISPSAVGTDKLATGGDIIIFRPLKSVLGVFLSYQILEGKVRSRFAKMAQGSTIIHIGRESLRGSIVGVPSIEEQQKIVDFLSTLDSKIDLESQILSTLQTLKKGLLQQMFV